MRSKWITAVVLLLVTSNCGGLDTFEIEETSRSVIPRGTLVEQLVGDLGFGDFLMLDITQNQKLQNQGVQRHEIDSVTVGAIDLRIEEPDGADFSFLSELEFFVVAEGQPRVRIASAMDFEAGRSRISMDIDDVELAAYVAAPFMNITAEAKGRRPDQETTVKADVTLLVDVNVEGVLCGE